MTTRKDARPQVEERSWGKAYRTNGLGWVSIPDMTDDPTPPARPQVEERSWGKAYWANGLGWVSIPDSD